MANRGSESPGFSRGGAVKWEGSISRHNPDCLVVTMVDYNDVPREVRIPYDMLQKHNTPPKPSTESHHE